MVLLMLALFLSGCLKLRPDKNGANSFQPVKQVPLHISYKDNGSIYQEGMRVGLFSDTNARYVGDILLVELNETTNSSATSNTNSSKDNKVDLPGPTLAGQPVIKNGTEILKNNFKGEREFNGQGTSAMNSNFTGKITVTVTKVLPNKNLIVQGEKLMLLNQSDEYIRFIGIVRPQDISQDNTVVSTRVANAHMAYSGTGDLASANKLGALGKFFQSQAWPY
jgi:flagellar L-ring protein precursor FlgH